VPKCKYEDKKFIGKPSRSGPDNILAWMVIKANLQFNATLLYVLGTAADWIDCGHIDWMVVMTWSPTRYLWRYAGDLKASQLQRKTSDFHQKFAPAASKACRKNTETMNEGWPSRFDFAKMYWV